MQTNAERVPVEEMVAGILLPVIQSLVLLGQQGYKGHDARGDLSQLHQCMQAQFRTERDNLNRGMHAPQKLWQRNSKRES